MSLSAGARLGPYEILSPLGRGGMGEVWRARDTKLRREVAIKALPAEFSADPERRARFEREAHLLASLNHPNVAAIYGLEEQEGHSFLILELVEGETLDEKIAAGTLPVREALAIAAQIAAGLSAAHEAGVIHRDLKPSNVKVKSDGSVKVLDLGLARAIDPPASGADASRSPTVTTGGTRSGIILGTAAYMSPEQARGKPLDKRTDIFSFGCVLYECLTGRQVFREDTVSDTLASVIRSDPDWSLLPEETPGRVRDLLKRCLQKDAQRRLHDIADARLEIEEAIAAPQEAPPIAPTAQPAPPRRGRTLVGIGLGLGAGALGGAILSRAFLSPSRVERPAGVLSAIALPAETRLRVSTSSPSLAFSLDGRKLVFRAVHGGVSQLYVRDLGQARAAPIPGTEGAFDPFFSPDGEWLAFFLGNQLRKVALSGGSPTVIVDAPPVSMGGTWAPDGSIILAPRPNSSLARLPAGAKAYAELTRLDKAAGERAHIWPQILPDGEHLLFVVRRGRDFDDIPASNIVIHSLKTGKRQTIVEGAAFGRYVAPGYVLFTKGSAVLAIPCDYRRGVATGPPVPVVGDVMTASFDAAPYLAASDNGLLAWVAGPAVPIPTGLVVRVDRSGREETLPLSGRRFSVPRLSPDGKRLAVVSSHLDRPSSEIAIYDFERGVLTALTPDPGRHFAPAWSPDGRRLAYTVFDEAQPRLAWQAADRSGEREFLSPGESPEFPSSFSPDGLSLLYTTGTGASIENMDIWLLSLEGKRARRAWLETAAREFAGFFSPDGRAVAYVSNESGRPEVYVQPYPGPGPKIKVSSDGGVEPAWAPGGREIFYRTSDSLTAATIRTTPDLSVGSSRPLFADRYVRWSREDGSRNYDVSPDGNSFLFIKTEEQKQEPVTQLQLMVNWAAALSSPEKP